MKTINDFGLEESKVSEFKKWAIEQYDNLEERHHRYIVNDVNAVQHFLNDFFDLDKSPWSTGVNLDSKR